MDSFNHTCHSVNVIYWLFDQSSMFSCFPACVAAVCISSLIKAPLGCWVHSGGIFIHRRGWVVRVCGGHPCWRHETKQPFNADQGFWGLFDSFFSVYTVLHYFLTWIRMNWKVSHISKWVKVSLHWDEWSLVRRSGAFMGCQLTTQPRNCWIMSFDDPLQLNGESLSRLCDGDRECSVWRGLL